MTNRKYELVPPNTVDINDMITWIANKEDRQMLLSVLPDVNMRLFRSSVYYKRLVLSACEYIRALCGTKFKDYSENFGMSGANAGVPWNIIAIKVNKGKPTEDIFVMINPHVLSGSNETVEVMSNCGSVRLTKRIPVKRFTRVTVNYFDMNGEEHTHEFDIANRSTTIQHEIQHNLGKLITTLST